MDPDQTPIQSKEAPFISDSKDDASPPKKRGKHGSDFDSSEQKHVLDFDLPKQMPDKIFEWLQMFHFRFYKLESPEVYQGMITKCEVEIKALEEAYGKAKCFFEGEFADLEKKQPGRVTYEVLETIRDEEKLVNGYMLEANNMLPCVKEDVTNYLTYRDTILFERQRTRDTYFDYLEQLANIPGFDKLIKYLMCSVGNYKLIQDQSGLTSLDMCVLVKTLQMEHKINFDIEDYNENKEQFGQSEMKKLLDGNEVSMKMKNLHILRDSFEKAQADVEKHCSEYESDTIRHMSRLVGCLRSAGVQLGIMREQLNLLCDKNVIVNGYPKRFRLDWDDACCP